MISLIFCMIMMILLIGFKNVNSDEIINVNGNIEMDPYNELYYLDLLKKFNQAFNDHDSNALISMMTDDSIFSQSMGSMPTGTQITGVSDIKNAFETTFTNFPDAKWIAREKDFVSKGENGNWYGLSNWIFQGTRKSDNAKFDTYGVDVFTMKNGKIYLKDAYRKDVPPMQT